MGKFDIDDILSDLGVKPDDPAQRPRRKRGGEADAPKKINRLADRAERSFSPLPSVPSGQRSYLTNINVDDDPSVPVKPKEVPKARVGEALSDIYDPEDDAHADDETDEKPRVPMHASGDLGETLVVMDAISRQQLASAQGVMKQSPGRRLIDVLIEQGSDEVKVYTAVAAIADVPFERVDLDAGLDGGFDGKLLKRLGVDYCKQQLILPLRIERPAGVPAGIAAKGTRIVIGGVQPDNVFLLDEVRTRLGAARIKFVVVTPFDIKSALEIAGLTEEKDVNVNELLADVDEADVELETAKQSEGAVDLEAQAGESPVIRYVNYIIQAAVKEGASDIHIEPSERKLKVRFRIDGTLFEMMNPPGSMSAAITSRLKIMANLDISERRLPQDGRIRCVVAGRKLDLRVSTLPNGHGEKTVMRILDTKSINVPLEDLGFAENDLVIWRQVVNEPHGIVLVTGPTGSGKTTTLYASLRQLDKQTMNICTVEDPVEYHLDGITQTQTHEKIGMTFAKALKAILRQDPDVVMLGEIRDLETAQTAIQAALTGHLVLSTLHTNDAPSSLTRLVNIGLEPFLVGAAVRGVLAQRLVRKLCPHCKVNERPNDDIVQFLEMNSMNPDGVYVAKGCDKCRNRGYAGRIGIFEMLVVDDQLRDIIARNPNVSEFRRLCIERGMVSLRIDGMNKVSRGQTTVEEVLAATESNI